MLPLLPPCDPPDHTNHLQISLDPELELYRSLSSDFSSDQTNVPDNFESSGPSSLPQNSGPIIIDFDDSYTRGSSFNADAQHFNTSAITSFQFIDVDMNEASGVHSSDKPKQP
jgi:hypothetical protein